jgi:hypothetical protein
MSNKKVALGGGGLEELRGRFDDWRNRQDRGKVIPRELWDEAVAASKRLGPSRVARALGLNHQRLNQQIVARGGTEAGASRQEPRELQPVAAQFVELGSLAGLVPAAGEPMVVELVAADGARLTIRTRQASASVLAMITAFRGHS